MEIEEFFARPHSNRQLVEFVDATKGAENSLPTAAKVGIGVAALFVPVIIGIPVLVGLGANEILNKDKRQGLVITQITKSHLQSFRLPPGHPSDHTIYVAHPAMPEQYIPFADFHRSVFEQKFNELVTLLSYLGAKTIEVHFIRGWGKEFAASLNVGLSGLAQAAGNVTKQVEQTLLYQAALKGHRPRTPENLKWYNHEPSWQQVASQRRSHGLKTFSLSYRYTSDFGINATVAARLNKAGFELGGTFNDHISTEWHVKGTF